MSVQNWDNAILVRENESLRRELADTTTVVDKQVETIIRLTGENIAILRALSEARMTVNEQTEVIAGLLAEITTLKHERGTRLPTVIGYNEELVGREKVQGEE